MSFMFRHLNVFLVTGIASSSGRRDMLICLSIHLLLPSTTIFFIVVPPLRFL